MTQAIAEIKRVLKPGGRFLFIPYADTHSSAAAGLFNPAQRMVTDITAGTLVGVGQISFVSLNDIKMMFPPQSWRFIQIERAENTNMLNPTYPVHGEYRVVVERLEN
jgi:SAM-dependent methyltransferase